MRPLPAAAMYSPQCHASDNFEVFPGVVVFAKCTGKFGHGGYDSIGLLSEALHACRAHGADFSWRQ
jgi:hypothetical protein